MIVVDSCCIFDLQVTAFLYLTKGLSWREQGLICLIAAVGAKEICTRENLHVSVTINQLSRVEVLKKES